MVVLRRRIRQIHEMSLDLLQPQSSQAKQPCQLTTFSQTIAIPPFLRLSFSIS